MNRSDSSIAAPGSSHWWLGILCPPTERFGLARLVCIAGLLALLVSAISPVDDSVQPDFSRHFRNGQRIVTAATRLQASRVRSPNPAAALITGGDHAGPVRVLEDLTMPDLHASLSSPGFERSHAGRAPPASLCS